MESIRVVFFVAHVSSILVSKDGRLWKERKLQHSTPFGSNNTILFLEKNGRGASHFTRACLQGDVQIAECLNLSRQ